MDLFPGALRGMGYSAVPMILSIIGTVGIASGMDFWNLSALSFFVCAVYFVSGFLAVHDHYAGDLLLFCKEKRYIRCEKTPI